MKEFYGGEIKEEYRTKEDSKEVITVVISGTNGIFVYPFNSEEFLRLTGVLNANFTNKRVYMGLSQEGANLASNCQDDLLEGRITLHDLDKRLVVPHFLRKE